MRSTQTSSIATDRSGVLPDRRSLPLTVRPAAGLPRFPMMDSVRGLGVMAVLTFHVFAITGALSHAVLGRATIVAGVVAVNCFFVMSGFLLARPFFAKGVGEEGIGPYLARFAWRRLLRILPAYWAALVILGLLVGLAGPLSHDWFKYFFFLQIYDQDTYGGGIPVAWTLCIEMSFYAMLAAWIAVFGSLGLGRAHETWLARQAHFLLVIVVASGLFRFLGQELDLPRTATGTLLGYGQWLFLGMLLAIGSVAYERGVERPPILRLLGRTMAIGTRMPNACWVIAVAVGAVAAYLLPQAGLFAVIAGVQGQMGLKRSGAIELGVTVATLLVVLPASAMRPSRTVVHRFLVVRPIMWLGAISYGMYLWHLPVAELIGTDGRTRFSVSGLELWSTPSETPLLWLATLAITTSLAYASYRWVELPCLRLRGRWRPPYRRVHTRAGADDEVGPSVNPASVDGRWG